jgi:hypothetical protein
VPRLPTRGGRLQKRPTKRHVDKGDASAKNRRARRNRGVVLRTPRNGVERSDRPGRHLRVVERTFDWLHRVSRSLVRYERRADAHEVFFTLERFPGSLRLPAGGGPGV